MSRLFVMPVAILVVCRISIFVSKTMKRMTTERNREKLLRTLSCGAALALLFTMKAIAAETPFTETVLDPRIGKVCYAVTLADVNGDGRPDAVAVSENRVLWFENPSWTPRVIIADQATADHVCIAPHDIDGDGQVDFALGAGWSGKNTGTIQWLGRGESLDQPWHVYAIGAEPTLHRMRWGDVLGSGHAQLTISPLNATQGTGVRLMAFEIPQNPRTDRWQSTVLNHDLNRMHNHWHSRWKDGTTATLTASREGVSSIHRQGDVFRVDRLGAGADAAEPNLRGAGEVKIGRLKGGRPFIATVEPMHGTMLVVYLPPTDPNQTLWERHVIDDGFKRGHALWLADMDGDGGDDIVFGHSDTPQVPGVNVYTCSTDDGTAWSKQIVDAGGMATEDLVVGDLNGDGRPDILAGGRASQNVKIYWNRAK